VNAQDASRPCPDEARRAGMSKGGRRSARDFSTLESRKVYEPDIVRKADTLHKKPRYTLDSDDASPGMNEGQV
jgi:hypothetical protein